MTDDYDRYFTEAKEAAYGSPFGFANFMNESGVTEEGMFVALALNLANHRPASAEKLRDYLHDRIDSYAQGVASRREMNRPHRSDMVSAPRKSMRKTVEAMFTGNPLGPKP